jgi:predicted nucleic acid-binding protein
MICVDTSVWVAAFSDSAGREAQHLSRLMRRNAMVMPSPVRVELLAGASGESLGPLRERFSALPQAVPDKATWDRTEEWLAAAVAAGQRFSLADLLIAATAAERNAPVWSLDADFERMHKLGFVELYAAP